MIAAIGPVFGNRSNLVFNLLHPRKDRLRTTGPFSFDPSIPQILLSPPATPALMSIGYRIEIAQLGYGPADGIDTAGESQAQHQETKHRILGCG